ncbi:16S rRNA (uracil(1498)-N(3))-methyltransferase [Urechidicola sp. KH5]
MQLFYSADIQTNDTSFVFDKIESRHIVRVLRKKTGDLLQITNGKGFLFEAEISIANDKNCVVKIVKQKEIKNPWSHKLHIAIAPTKNNDRFEWFLEKATEIGIDEITPIICDHSERKIVKMERLEKVLVSAMKQSLKFRLPQLNEPRKLKEFLKDANADLKCIAHCEPTDKKSLKNVLNKKESILLLIGPEGDFSTDEINLAKKTNFIPITLGESRLRTETAGIVATQSVAFFNE